MTAAKEPCVEEIVEDFEKFGLLTAGGKAALLSDWRKRGEARDTASALAADLSGALQRSTDDHTLGHERFRALIAERDSARALLKDIDGLSNINESIRARIDKELGPTSEDEPRSPRAS